MVGMANIQATQVKITLPNELYLYVKSKAEKFDLNLASYIRHLVINDVRDMNIPVFKMSEKTERNGLQALQEFKKGKTTKIDNIDKYFDSI